MPELAPSASILVVPEALMPVVVVVACSVCACSAVVPLGVSRRIAVVEDNVVRQ